MEKSFKYYKISRLLYMMLSIAVFYIFIYCLRLPSHTHFFAILFGVTIICLTPSQIYPSLFITITFKDKIIEYKTPLKKITISKDNIEEITWIVQSGRYSVDTYKYENDATPFKSGIILIGYTEKYPRYLFTKKASPTFITLQYRDELKEILDALVVK